MKKTIYPLLFVLLQGNAPAQKLDSLKDIKVQSLVERIANDISVKAKKAFTKGKEYSERKLYEAELENQIENRIFYEIPDKDVRDFFNYLILNQKIDADVTSISNNSVTTTVAFSYDYDNARILKQYEFSVFNGAIEEILSQGRTWAELNDESLNFDDFVRKIKLHKTVSEKWDRKKEDFERKNPSVRFAYERASAPNSEYWIIFNEGLTEATVGVDYKILDQFGNIEGNTTYYSADKYRFNGKWHFEETIFESIRRDKGIPEKEDYLEKSKKYLHEGIDFVKSIIN